MKIPAWLRKKPSGTRTAQLSCDACAYWERNSKNWQQDVMRWRVHAQAAESKLAAALLQKDEWEHYALDCRVHAQAAESKLAAALLQKDEWEDNAKYWADRAEAAESKLAARQASLAKYEVKRKAKRAVVAQRDEFESRLIATGWTLER
jgi:hypothetical protein